MITQSAQNAKSLPPCRNLALASTIFAAIFEIMHKLTIDKVDRIAFAIAKIKKLVQENMSV